MNCSNGSVNFDPNTLEQSSQFIYQTFPPSAMVAPPNPAHIRYDSLEDLIGYPSYPYANMNNPVSPSSTDGSSSYGFTDDGNTCVAPDSSSGTPPNGKVKKYRSLETQIRQRRAANERERRRMLSINKAFDLLRVRVPTLPYEKRLSKVDTLQLTIRYIELLQELIQRDDDIRMSNGELDAASNTERVGKRAHGTSYAPPAKKVIIQCHNAMNGEEELFGTVPVRGHSLSWKKPNDGPSQTLSAKLWTPQNLSNGHTLTQEQFPVINDSFSEQQPSSSSDSDSRGLFM